MTETKKKKERKEGKKRGKRDGTKFIIIKEKERAPRRNESYGKKKRE